MWGNVGLNKRLHFRVSRGWAFKQKEDKGFTGTSALPLSAPILPPGSSFDFLRKEVSGFQLRGKMLGCSVLQGRFAGKERTVHMWGAA